MPAAARESKRWTTVQRLATVLGAVVALQAYVVATATPLVSTISLAPPTTTVAPVVAPDRPVPVAEARTILGQGWAGPVSAATARYAYDFRSRYQSAGAEVAAVERAAATTVLGLGKAAIADIEVLPVPPPPPPVTMQYPGLTVVNDPQSPYQLELNTFRRVVEVTIADVPNVRFEIDYRDRATDLHRIGITPVLVGHRLEGNFHRVQGELTFPLVTPTFDAGRVTHTTVVNEGGTLLVRFDGGPYSNLSAHRGNEDPTFLEVRIDVSERRVRMDLAGLYYVRPAVGAELFITAGAETSTMVIEEGVPSFLTYIENPTRVEIADPSYGSYRMKTDVTRLQVQWDGVGTAFELDFDHAYKDRGQTSVQSRLVFPTPIEP